MYSIAQRAFIYFSFWFSDLSKSVDIYALHLEKLKRRNSSMQWNLFLFIAATLLIVFICGMIVDQLIALYSPKQRGQADLHLYVEHVEGTVLEMNYMPSHMLNSQSNSKLSIIIPERYEIVVFYNGFMTYLYDEQLFHTVQIGDTIKMILTSNYVNGKVLSHTFEKDVS